MSEKKWNKERHRYDWPVPPHVRAVIDALDTLTDAERMDVFAHFCKSCGLTDPECQCWNDE
jgi:hypothetical protein